VSRSSTDTNRTTSRLVTLTIGAVAAAIVGVALFGGPEAPEAGEIQTATSGYAYQVGDPGVGRSAPPIQAEATTGGFDLAAMDGQRVLLYFQEGLMCQPCWDQLTEIESRWPDVEALGIDTIASITTDELPALRQKVAIERITSPVIADPDRAVSERYSTLDYGMMGGSHNGHTFVVVGPDGTIEWRADYGGAPDYTMYLPVDALLTDLRTGLEPA
jgi:peroxiredoxin